MGLLNNKIKWTTVIYAPFPYQIELVSGETFWFYDEKGVDGLGFNGHAGAGWKVGGINTSGGSPASRVDIPLGVNLTWLSHTERKYYHIKYHLPRQVIAEAFDKKLDREANSERNKERHNTLAFAFSPGGFVSLRVGGASTKVIANFQAEEVDIPWEFFARTNHFNPNGLSEERYNGNFIKDMPEPYQSQALKGIFPTERWKNYCLKKYPWHVATKMDVYGYRQFCVDGDSFFITKADFKNIDQTTLQAVPTWFKWFYKENGKRYQSTVCFSRNIPGQKEDPEGDVEVFAVFEQYFANNTLATALVIEKVAGNLAAYLTNGSKKLDLKLYHSNTWKLRDGQYPWF